MVLFHSNGLYILMSNYQQIGHLSMLVGMFCQLEHQQTDSYRKVKHIIFQLYLQNIPNQQDKYLHMFEFYCLHIQLNSDAHIYLDLNHQRDMVKLHIMLRLRIC